MTAFHKRPWQRTVRHAALALLATPALAWAQSADLVANNAGPSTSAAGSPFTYVLRLSNNGAWAADGATFTSTMPAGAIEVAATCTNATGGAVCPAAGELSFSNTEVSGTLPTLPDQGLVEITVTGVYGIGSPTSVTSTATITPPAGVTETHPVTNTSTVNTTLITDAKLVVSKTQTVSGDTVTYTISLVNEGNAAAHGATFRDYLYSSGATSAPSRATVHANFVSCTAVGGAECPANSEFGSFSGIKGTTSRTLFNTPVPRLPAGGSLTVVYTATVEPDTDTCGSSTGDLRNYATITPPSGITNTVGTPTVYTNLSVAGTAACAAGTPFGVVSKTQTLADGTPLANGSPLAYGTPIRYTITAVNNTGVDADGAMLRDYSSYSGSSTTSAGYRSHVEAKLISCVAEDGAVCPADSAFTNISRGGGSSSNQGNLFNVTIPTFPAGGKVTVTYEAVFAPSTYCGIIANNFTNNAQLSPPSSLTGYTTRTAGAVSVRLGATEACADVQVSKSQSTAMPQPGVPFDYEVTVTNHGPGDADGALWSDYLSTTSGSFARSLRAQIEFVSCTPAGGAECPASGSFNEWDDVLLNTSRYLVPSNTPIPRLPEGASVTLRYRMTLAQLAATSCSSATGTLTNTATAKPANAYSAKTTTVSMPLTCADVGISKTVDPIFVQPGDDVTYTITVSSAGLGAAANLVVSDPLPSYFQYTSATCEVVKPSATGEATACGASVDYDPATRTVSSTIANVGMLGEVKFTILGKAGVEPGTHKNIARVELPGGLFDPILATNVTDVNVQLQNTSSPITVAKQVSGLTGSGGLPADTTFTGTVTCGSQPSQPWSVTVPAGSVSGTSAPLTFYDTEVCTVTEDAPPAPPAGYAWEGTPTIGNSADPLGPSTPRTVDVTNALRRLTGSLALTKAFDGPADAVAQVDGDFDFAIDCGADGSFTAQVSVVGGASTTATVDDLPTGASCTVSETASADAPSGFVWDAPTYDTNPLVMPADEGAVATFQVTNTLKSGAVTPVPTLGTLGLGLLAGLLAAFGAVRRRRQFMAS